MPTGFVEITLDVFGETVIARGFEMLSEQSRDLSEPLGELMDQILDSVAAQFDTEGAASGSPWAPLSDEYGQWKAEHYPGRKILIREGVMQAAMLNRAEAVHVTPEQAIYEPISEIARYHQAGADWLGPAWEHPGPYEHHLPQRKMVDLSEEFKHQAVDRTFARWLAKQLRDDSLAGVGA